MKTTTTSHTRNTSHAAHEGETTMRTIETSHAEITRAPSLVTEAATMPAAIAATPAVTVPATTPNAATLAYIQTCMALLEQLDAVFPQRDALTARDKRHTAKARKGSDRFTPQIVALARQYGVNLALVPLDTISQASMEAMALVPFQKRIESIAARTASRMFELQSTSWSGSAKLYSVLKRLSKDSGGIATGLAPVEQFFNHRHPSVAKNHPKTKKGKSALAAAKDANASPAPAPVTTAAPAAATSGVAGS